MDSALKGEHSWDEWHTPGMEIIQGVIQIGLSWCVSSRSLEPGDGLASLTFALLAFLSPLPLSTSEIRWQHPSGHHCTSCA